MPLDKLGMILISNNRSRAYIQRMVVNELLPAHVILLKNLTTTALAGQTSKDITTDTEQFTTSPHSLEAFQLKDEPLEQTLKENNVSFSEVKTSDVNDRLVLDLLISRQEDYWVYSGPGGVLLKKPILNTGKKFLHIHPGIVPNYRGSTTIYYSLLETGTCGASAIFLSSEIDAGKLIETKEFSPPENRKDIDYLYDPLIRSELLVDVLKKFVTKGEFHTTIQDNSDRTFYIMHPVLRHICILSKR